MEDVRKLLKSGHQSMLDHETYQKHENKVHKRSFGRYVGDFVYGANDGIVTTFAVVAGASGGSLPHVVILILGFANLFADGISMGASNYLGARSEQDYAKAQREKEEMEIKNLRDLEVAEIREIFAKKGFSGKELENVVKTITSNRKVWVDTMMKEELGINVDVSDDPKKHALATFVAFAVAGFFPLVPYVFPGMPNPFLVSAVIGAITLFIVGSLRSLITVISWIRGGLEVLLIGSAAAAVAYFLGEFIQKLVS